MFLRAVAQPLMAKVKSSTGIVGLEVVPHAREVLIGLAEWDRSLGCPQACSSLYRISQDARGTNISIRESYPCCQL
ncbi:hypothetical protein JHK82_044922 [Glycine max]|nr:hypothetical protein JHK82_044922 [Glycine max]